MVVQVAFGVERLVVAAQHGSRQFLGRGFSVGAGDADDGYRSLPPVVPGQLLQGFQPIVHQHVAAVSGGDYRRVVHHGAGASGLQGLCGEGIAVKIAAPQGYEHRAFGTVPAVGRHARALLEYVV